MHRRWRIRRVLNDSHLGLYFVCVFDGGRTLMAQKQQQQRLRFKIRKSKNQAQTIKEQEKQIAEWIRQQQDPRHNQD